MGPFASSWLPLKTKQNQCVAGAAGKEDSDRQRRLQRVHGHLARALCEAASPNMHAASAHFSGSKIHLFCRSFCAPNAISPPSRAMASFPPSINSVCGQKTDRDCQRAITSRSDSQPPGPLASVPTKSWLGFVGTVRFSISCGERRTAVGASPVFACAHPLSATGPKLEASTTFSGSGKGDSFRRRWQRSARSCQGKAESLAGWRQPSLRTVSRRAIRANPRPSPAHRAIQTPP